MASPGDRGPAARKRKHLRVLLPFTPHRLRIPDELAREIGSDEALIIVPYGRGVVQRVEVGRDGDGVFLGRGWQEFADACGVCAGWFLILRHHGGGVLTVKAFDSSCCLRELGTQPSVEVAMNRTESSRRPQFISLLPPDSMEKMLIPTMIVQNCMPREHRNNPIAVLFGPLGKHCEIELKMSQSDMFFAGGWSQFLALHGITRGNCLLVRYDGNMTFTAKVFEPNGCQRLFKDDIGMQKSSTSQDKEKQQEAPLGEDQERLRRYPASIQKCKSNTDWPSSEGQKKEKASINSSNKAPLRDRSIYQIGSPSWIKKVICTRINGYVLPLATAFCDAIGLQEPSMIMLKTSMDSPESWQVQGCPGKNNCSYRLVQGWKRFCQENSLMEGDTCTFNVVGTTLWHVVITRKEKINQYCYQETPSAASSKRKSDNYISSNEEQKGPNGTMIPSNKASSSKCIYEIGPPAWMKKKINTSTIENCLNLPLIFCEALGLRERCTITLKVSMSGTTSWQARVLPYKNCSHLRGLGWKRFCQENRIKEGDVCTFNVVETKLWHVVITRSEEKIDLLCSQESSKSKKGRISIEGQKRPKVSMVSLNKASWKRSVFEIGPPAWIKKEITMNTIKNNLVLPLSFCLAIGLREPRTVTFKTSTSSNSWQVRIVPYMNRCQVSGSGWKRFCNENMIKVGDVCTFQITETTLWHISIARL